MAERRMFARTIIDSDAFLDMPATAQLLYFHLGMRADDDGFINNAKMIQRVVRASDDDLTVLIAKKFIIPFENGVVVIKHWKINNYIQVDRYKPTKYKELLQTLALDENNSYSKNGNLCIQDVSTLDTQVRLGKVSIEIEKEKGINTLKEKRFTPPSVSEVKEYCDERKNGISAEEFVDFYSSKGWMVGKNRMKDWKAAVRTWEGNRKETSKKQPNGKPKKEDINLGWVDDYIDDIMNDKN